MYVRVPAAHDPGFQGLQEVPMSSRILPLDVLFLVPRILRKIQALRLVLAIFLFSAPCWPQQTQPSPQGQQEPPRPDVPPGQQVSPQAPAQNPAPLTLPA